MQKLRGSFDVSSKFLVDNHKSLKSQNLRPFQASRVPRVAPRTGHVHQVLEQRPPLQLLSRFRCDFGSLSGLGSSRELPDRQASGAGGHGRGGLSGQVCVQMCFFTEGKQEGDGREQKR